MIRRLTDARRSNVHLSGDESLPGGDESAPVTPSDGDKKTSPANVALSICTSIVFIVIVIALARSAPAESRGDLPRARFAIT